MKISPYLSAKSWSAIICYSLLGLLFTLKAQAGFERGIYISQNTLSSSKLLKSLVQQAKLQHINAMVIDLKKPTRAYRRGINYVHAQHLRIVTRIVVFPNGGQRAQIRNHNYWHKRWQLINYALGQHSDAIQLDYIRYNDRTPSRRQNVRDIVDVVKYFKNKIGRRASLQVDIFGMVAHKPLLNIGQDAHALAPYVDAMCPMVYPSHYPSNLHYPKNAYTTVYASLRSLKHKLKGTGVKIYAYIEVYSYRHRMTWKRRVHYIQDEIRAVHDSHVDGWYAWSPRNRYAALLQAMHNKHR